MKGLLFLIALSMPIEANARKAKTNVLLEVNFKRDQTSHQYQVIEISKLKPDYVLSFKDEKRKLHSIKLSKQQAEMISHQADHLMWEARYKGKALPETPREYMNLRVGSEKASVYHENGPATGKAYGFLNSLHQRFE